MKPFRLLLAALLPAVALPATPAHAADSLEARVIVKLRDTSPLKQIQSGSRMERLAQRIGVSARGLGQPGASLHVMQASGIGASVLAARLAREADVEYAVPDRIKTIRSVPNDPYFGNQWYLQNPDPTRLAATGALSAWDASAGSASVVVAVVDTGVRFDHEDLSAKLLPGYDFISDDLISGDGQSGRDADASDPGDYLSSADLANASLRNLCNTTTPHASSWHGTQVAGIGGATRVLPVRVLGKCGGYDSDIIAGMRWAAGLAVTGIPANPNPARIINLSLAGGGTCSAAYADAIAEIRAAGVMIVAAAGNETGAVEEPANCAGVLAVAGIRHAGTKVGYSSYGSEVGISAPAGNCVNVLAGEPCLFPFINTINLGSTTPGSNGYTGINAVTVGTSFAVPLVSGTAALMLAANPALSELGLRTLIRQSASAFPFDATLPTCPAVTSDGQCNCTTSTCGAGMLNTAAAVGAAVAAASASPTASIGIDGTRTAGTPFTLSATGSTAASGATVVAWQWTQRSGPASGSFGSAAGITTAFTAPSAGTYVVSLTVTDNLGRTGTTQTSFDVQPAPASSKGGGGGTIDISTLAGMVLLAAAALRGRRVSPRRS